MLHALEFTFLCDHLANDCTSFSDLQLSPIFAFIIILDSSAFGDIEWS